MRASTRAHTGMAAAFPALPLYLAPLIIPLAVVSFDYETSERPRARSLTRSLACAHASATRRARAPMCCTTPNGIAPSRRGGIARYTHNGPLHNGIRTCDIPESHRRDAAHDAAQRRSPARFSGTFGDCSMWDFSLVTQISYIKDCVS